MHRYHHLSVIASLLRIIESLYTKIEVCTLLLIIFPSISLLSLWLLRLTDCNSSCTFVLLIINTLCCLLSIVLLVTDIILCYKWRKVVVTYKKIRDRFLSKYN